jgi:NADPH:quinone reductase-like Zn-dependent oxidoreductase
MRAFVIQKYGGPEVLALQDLPRPEPQADEVLIRVEAFGLNRAETYMRKGAWGDVAPVSGIECVGRVAADPSGRLQEGQKVAALMGGMGRTRNGSYAEFACLPFANVVPLSTDLPWEELAALPESYATAWSCLFGNLELRPGQTLLLRGATSALGQAALNLAARAGVEVVASTRRPEAFALLKELGAARTIQEGPELAAQIQGFDAALDLIGTSTLLDSLRTVSRGGRACMAGFLGGHDPIADFHPLAHLPSGVHLSFFASFMFGTPGFELDRVPLQSIVDDAARGRYRAKPSRVFRFEDLPEAHRVMEAGLASGKLVVRM